MFENLLSLWVGIFRLPKILTAKIISFKIFLSSNPIQIKIHFLYSKSEISFDFEEYDVKFKTAF